MVNIYHHCVRHKTSSFMITKANPFFVFGVGSSKEIDLVVVRSFRGDSQILMPFKVWSPEVFTLVLGLRILEEQGVPLMEGKKILKCKNETYALGSLKKSISNAHIYTCAKRDEDHEFSFISMRESYSEREGCLR